jgi:acyl-CoA synthetase (AMP-forming)/AMP-acid ligase II
MQFLTKLSLVAAAATSFLGALAVPMNTTLETRAAAQVITKCTVPNTAALTWVRTVEFTSSANLFIQFR